MSIPTPAPEGPIQSLGDPMGRTTPGAAFISAPPSPVSPVDPLGAAALGTARQVQDSVNTRVNIEAQARGRITVRLVGHDYTVKPPKAAFAMRMARATRQAQASDDADAMFSIMEGWILKAFGPTQGLAIQERLEDEEDDLDIPHIMELMKAIMELVSENPTM